MSFKSTLLFFLLLLASSTQAYAQQEKMIFAVDVIRHGDRTPIHDLPHAPYAWPQGAGQLTPAGMQQEYQLGVTMRKRYIEETALLPTRYNAETLYVRSSDFDRTLMSAESLLFGLYPLGTGPTLPHSEGAALPSAYQPIPIHTIPLKQDSLLVWESSPHYHAWLEKYVYSRPDWQKKTAELQPHFARWSQLTGLPITNLAQIIYLGDTLYIHQLYQLPLPPGMTDEDAKTIIAARQWAFTTAFKSPEVGQITGYPLLQVIGSYLQQASQQANPLKWVLFSSHDSTILSLMSAMHVPLTTPPRYASDLNFALFETTSGEKWVKVSLNGEAVTLPICGGPVCKLAQFEKQFHNETQRS